MFDTTLVFLVPACDDMAGVLGQWFPTKGSGILTPKATFFEP